MNLFEIMDDVDYCLLGSIGQAAADAKSLNLWSNSTLEKTRLWLTDDPDRDPTISRAIASLDGTGAGNFESWMQQYCPALDGVQGYAANFTLNHWSSALALQLQMLIVKNDKNASDWTAVVGAIGPFSSMISATMTQDTTTGDAEGKNMQSQMGTDNSATQTIADFGGTNSQNLGALSNVLAQMSPA